MKLCIFKKIGFWPVGSLLSLDIFANDSEIEILWPPCPTHGFPN